MGPSGMGSGPSRGGGVAGPCCAGRPRRFGQRPAVEVRGLTEVEVMWELAEALGTH